LQEVAEAAAEQVGVAGPAGGQVVAVLHDEGGRVIGRGAAGGEGYRSSLELAARVVEGGLDLVLDVGGVGPVVAAEPPGRGQVGGAFHVLGQAGGAAAGQDAAAGVIAGAGQDQDAVADRAHRLAGRPEPGHLLAQHRGAQVLPHPGCVPARQQQPVEGGRVQPRPRLRRGEPGVPGELGVVVPGLGLGA
jgi:hypothetical protein